MRRSLLVKVSLSVALVVAAVGVIVYTASQSSGLFRFVDEVVAQSRQLKDREVWMAGALEAEGHEVVSEAGKRERHRFYLSHKGQKIEVRYTGSFPASVRPGNQLIVRGRVASPGRFEAVELRTKCPSKYKSQYEARR